VVAAVKAREYTSVEPLETEPIGPLVIGPEGRREAIEDALRGVTLGAHDRRTLTWMVKLLDQPTLRTIVSLIERAHLAGMVETLDAELYLERCRQQQRIDEHGSPDHPVTVS